MESNQKLIDAGYWFGHGPDLLRHVDWGDGFRDFAAQWDVLPADPYLTDGEPFRFRRHGRVIFDAGADKMTVLPPSDYTQASDNNPLFGDVPRRFPPIEWTRTSERLVNDLVRTSVTEVLRLPGRSLLHLHQVRITGGPRLAGAPAPEGPHRDGFDFISIHLIGRDVDGGGDTTLARNDGATFGMTLTQPMDSVYVDDRRYIHDTSPIVGRGRDVYRDVLLMSFEPAGTLSC